MGGLVCGHLTNGGELQIYNYAVSQLVYFFLDMVQAALTR